MKKANMHDAINAIMDIKKNCFPEGKELYFGPEFKKSFERLIKDIDVLVSDEEELDNAEYRKKVEDLHKLLLDKFKDYKRKKIMTSEDMSVKEMNDYLKTVASFFEQRYRFIYENAALRKLYQKSVDTLYNRRVDITGDVNLLHGPAIFSVTHSYDFEPFVISAISKDYVFWVADPKTWIGPKTISWFDLPIIGGFMKGGGAIRIDRQNMQKYKIPLLEKSLAVLEHGRVVGIMTQGGNSPSDIARFKAGHKGTVFLAQQAINHLHRNIPIIPIGVKADKLRYIIRIGKPVYVNPYGDSNYRTTMTKRLLTYISRLAS